jgi:SPP1 gp7 family putative phage head morphogenesis protein
MSFLLDPVPHKEAADFIKSKPAVSRAVFDRLLPELKARAFTVTGIEDATVLQGIRDRIAELPAGGNWEDTKEELVENISPFLAKGDTPEDAERAQIAATRRAELLLRLHGFQAYSAAAYQVMDAQRDVFPYWQYKSMNDAKVRDTHAALNGVVLPANAKFWERHYPPWEWGCRCQVVPLMEEDVEEIREAEAGKPLEERKVLEGESLRQIEERGQYVAGPNQIYDLRTPIEKGKPGAFEWSPADLRIPLDGLRERYDAETFAQFETWARGTDIPGQGRTVWEWIAGTIVTPSQTTQQNEGTSPSQIRSAAAMAKEIDAILSMGAATSAQHERILDLLSLPDEMQAEVKFSNSKVTGEELKGLNFVRRITSRSVLSGADVLIKRRRNRAVADPYGKYIDGKNMSAQTVSHEIGHIIEARSPEALQRSIDFRNRRAPGETPKWIGQGYGRNEIAVKDEWEKRGGHLYSGKVYLWKGREYATEVLSMGFSRLVKDAAKFAQEDRDYFDFVVDSLRLF